LIIVEFWKVAGQLTPPIVTTPLVPKFEPVRVRVIAPAVLAVVGLMAFNNGPLYENVIDEVETCD
jgi:hypothetical protein